MGFLDVNEVRTRYTATDETSTVNRDVRSSITAVSTAYMAATQAAQQALRVVDEWVGGAVRQAHELQTFNTRLGASVEGLQQIKLAAELSNVEFGQVSMGMQRMTRRVAEAAQGMGEAKGALLELGIDAAALKEMLPDEQLRIVAERLSDVEGQSDRVRLAFKLFDSEGVSVVQMLDELKGKRIEDIPLLSQKHIDALDRISDLWTTILQKARTYASIAIANVAEAIVPARDDAAELDRMRAWMRAGNSPGSFPGGPGGPYGDDFAARMWMFGAAGGFSFPTPERRQTSSTLRGPGQGALGPIESYPGNPASLPGEIMDWAEGLPEPVMKMREESEKAVTELKAVGEAVIDLGQSWETTAAMMSPAQARMLEWIEYADSEWQNLGATMVDVGFGFADQWANAMVLAANGTLSFADAVKSAFRDLANEAIRQLNRIIARQAIAGFFKLIGLPSPTAILGGDGGGGGTEIPFDYGGGGGGDVLASASYGGSSVPPVVFAVPSGGDSSRNVTVNATIKAQFASRAEVRSAAMLLRSALAEAGA